MNYIDLTKWWGTSLLVMLMCTINHFGAWLYDDIFMWNELIELGHKLLQVSDFEIGADAKNDDMAYSDVLKWLPRRRAKFIIAMTLQVFADLTICLMVSPG